MKKLSIDVLLSEGSGQRQIVNVSPTDLVTVAAQRMTEAGVGLVLVMIERKLVGVVSERDLVGKWICSKNFPKPLKVEEIMTKNVEIATPEDTVFDCYLRFSARNCRHLPVVDSFGEVLGVLSLRDVTGYVVSQLSEQE